MTPDDALTREQVREALDGGAAWTRVMNGDASDADVLDALRAALDDPARWCGVVGVVARRSGAKTLRGNVELTVTPHQEGA